MFLRIKPIERLLVHDGMLHRVRIPTDSLKAFASFWPRTGHLGIELIGGEEVKNRLEETEGDL